MRKTDGGHIDYRMLRSEPDSPTRQIVVDPGSVIIASENTALVCVLGSSVIVTIYDRKREIGGLCHFLRPLPMFKEHATPIFGLPATVALVRQFLDSGSEPESLVVGIYGGAFPDWASARQREISRGNVAIARDVLKKKNIAVSDEDVYGSRGRKIIYMSGSNEIGIMKTDKIRKSDWFPPVAS